VTLTDSIMAAFSQYPAFTYRDVRLRFGGSHSANVLSRTLSHLKSTGRIFAIRKGRYSVVRDSMVSGFAFRPFYYGLLSAMSIRDMWTQNTRPDIITTKTVSVSRTNVFGKDGPVVLVHHIPTKYLFGFDTVRYGSLSIPVSDPEKTLIDLFYFRVRLPIQDWSGLLKAIDPAKLDRYLKHYDSHTKASVTNFVRRNRDAALDGKLESPY